MRGTEEKALVDSHGMAKGKGSGVNKREKISRGETEVDWTWPVLSAKEVRDSRTVNSKRQQAMDAAGGVLDII